MVFEKIEKVVGGFKINSKSEQINKLFASEGVKRLNFFWHKDQNFNFSNSELLEIHSIGEYLRNRGDVTPTLTRLFYDYLILSQDGPFDSEVFSTFLILLDRPDALIHLITKSQGISTERKLEWLGNKYTLKQSFGTVYFDFFENGIAAQCGISHTKYPYNETITDMMMQFGYDNFNLNATVKKFLWEALDSLKADDFDYWYRYSVLPNTKENERAEILSEYPQSSAKILKECFDSVNGIDDKMKLAMHDNFPEEIKMEMYEKTKDDRLLPKIISDIFLF